MTPSETSAESGNLIHITQERWRKITKNFLLFVIAIVCLGQPNGLFLVFPQYPALLTLLVIVFFGLYGAEKLVFGQEYLRIPRINALMPLILFFLYSLSSLFYSIDAGFGARILISSSLKFMLFVVIVDLCENRSDLRRLLAVVTIMGMLFAIQGVLQVIAISLFHVQPNPDFSSQSELGAVSYDYRLQSYGIFGFVKVVVDLGTFQFVRCQASFVEPGYFANFLELSLFTTVAYYAMNPTAAPWKRNVALAIQVVALLLSFSTAGWFCVGAATVVYALITVRSRVRLILQTFSVLIVLGGIAAVGAVAFPTVAERVYAVVWASKFVSEWDGVASSGQQRVSDYEFALEQMQAHPLFGLGTNQLRVVYAGAHGANNALLTVGAELGIVGLIIYLTLLGSIAVTILGNIMRALRFGTPDVIRLTGACTGCTIALLLHTLFVDTYTTFLFWIGMAIVYVNVRAFRDPDEEEPSLAA